MQIEQVIFLAVLVLLCGAFGGFVCALQTRNTNLIPEVKSPPPGVLPTDVKAPAKGVEAKVPAPTKAIKPGLVLNASVGALAAVLSWGLYGPLAGVDVLNPAASTQSAVMTLSGLGGAIFVGYTGSQWLSTEADKRTATATGLVAQSSGSNPLVAQAIQSSDTPMDAFKTATSYYEKSRAPTPPGQ